MRTQNLFHITWQWSQRQKFITQTILFEALLNALLCLIN